MTGFGLTGKDAEHILDSIHITANKNTIPNEKQKPFITSGIRIGTPAITTRGFKEKEAQQVAEWIITALENPKDSAILKQLNDEVLALTTRFPLYEK